MLHDGNWKCIQEYRKKKGSKFSKLRASSGEILSSNERAEGLADYLEQIQWAVRPDTIPSSKGALFNFDDLKCDRFQAWELQSILYKLKK
eukprot:8891804-Karenia_brevis.AAC.1